MTSRTKTAIFCLALASLSNCGRPSEQNVTMPPPPNFGKAVDYTAWFREQLRFADEDNASDDYREFFQTAADTVPDFLAPTSPLAKQNLEDIVMAPQPWRPDDFQELQAYLKEISPYLDTYVEGSRHKFFAIPSELLGATLIDTSLPHLGNSYVLSKCMLAVAWRNEGSFNPGAFAEKMGIVLRHSGHVLQGLTLVECRTGIRERDMVYTSILASLDRNSVCNDSLRGLEGHLRQYDPVDMRNYLARSVQFEKACSWDLLQQMAELSPVFGTGVRLNKHRAGKMVELFTTSTTRKSRSFFRKLLREDPRELCGIIEAYYSKCAEVIKGGFCVDYEKRFNVLYSEHTSGHPYFEVFPMTDFARSYKVCVQTERMRRITHLVLQILLHREANASFPGVLSQLEGSCEIIRDPLTGQPFQYDFSQGSVKVSGPEMVGFKAITVEVMPCAD